MEILELVKKHNGFNSFNPMQEKAINAGLLEHNIVVSSPTASGKTVVAEIASLNNILNKHKKVVYTCPLRALASEHYNDFKEKYSKELSIKAVPSTGDFDSSGKYLSSNDVIFTTFEKLNSLLTHRADWLSQIGLLIVDEIHTLGSDRGPTIEMVLTKLRFLNKHLQVLGLSATIPNAKEISKWLGAKLVESDYRPVKLREGVFLDGEIFFEKDVTSIAKHQDELSSIALDTLSRGKQALFFLNTRKRSEATAKKLASITSARLNQREKNVLEGASEKILNALETPTEQCRTLASLVKQGVSFHNAGLLEKQRRIIEDLFKRNYLKFICSTPTLAQGINMPAFRVVMPSPYRYSGFGMERIPVSEWKQVAGRAGRPKYDSEGEAILVAKTEFEKDDYFDYFINGEVEDVESKLESEFQLRFHLLSIISSGFVFDLESAEKFFSGTFYGSQMENLSDLFGKITKIISELEEMQFVKTTEKRIDATPLGKRVAELYLDPSSAHKIIQTLKKEKHNDLSYLFMIANTTEFRPLLTVPKAMQSELWERVTQHPEELPVDVNKEMFYDDSLLSKYWVSLLLKEWIDEVREQAIVDSYNVQPGILRAKLKNADWLAYACLELAKILELKTHFLPLVKIRKRLQHGVKEELVPLCELRGIGRVRSRMLFRANVKTIADLKKLDAKDLEKILNSPAIAVSVKKQLSARK